MIRKVELINFQSHKHTVLEFTEGINVFSGTSDSGKSAVLRAIYWVVYNEPSGTSMISWWAYKGKKQEKDTRVILTLDDGTTVERIRGKINGYIINGGQPLEAVGNGVPDEVRKILNFSEINAQQQMDSPFLLSESAGEVARYFNRIVNMEDADVYQAGIESKRRTNNAEIATVEQNITNLEKDVGGFDWIPKAEKLIKKIERLEEMSQGVYKSIQSIGKSMEDLSRYKTVLSTCDCIERAMELVEGIETGKVASKGLRASVDTLERSMDVFTMHQKTLATTKALPAAEKLVAKIDKLITASGPSTRKVDALEDSLATYTKQDTLYRSVTKELKEEERTLSLVELCPTCGHRLATITTTF